jgi:signal transduction histidine kinase
MAAPLLAREALLGVVYVDNRTLPGVFSVRKLDLLRVLANHVAIALRNAELFDQLDVARSELALSERLRAIGQVATFVAHEVKNPLASIRILLDGLQEKWADAEFRSKVFDMVPREVARLDKAVSQILEYARPTPLIKVPVCLSSLVDSAVAILEPEMERRQVRVERLFQPDLPTVLADGERLREVFVNVIKNGIQALTRRPEKQLRLFIQRPDELHEEVVVEDTGPGLAEADIQGLFEPFRALRGSATGVGLALCQKVIREHGGRITAENLPDGGARLRISLPIGGA